MKASLNTIAALLAAMLALTGCGGNPSEPAATVTVTASSSATAAQTSAVASNPPGTYGPDGLYSVGQPRDGIPNVIEAGRYQVQKARPNDPDGVVMRCATVLCGPAYPGNAETSSPVRSTFNGDHYIFDMDVAVYLSNAILTKTG
jgi:hypothetical protein